MLPAEELKLLWVIYLASCAILAMVLWRITKPINTWIRSALVICFLMIFFTPKPIRHETITYLAPMLVSNLIIHYLET